MEWARVVVGRECCVLCVCFECVILFESVHEGPRRRKGVGGEREREREGGEEERGSFATGGWRVGQWEWIEGSGLESSGLAVWM